MGRIQQVTPQAILDLYNTLPDEGQNQFVRQLGDQSTAEAVGALIGGLCPEERVRLVDQLLAPLCGYFQEMELRALDAADALPAGSREDRRAFLQARVVEYRAELTAGITKMVGITLGEARNRHSDPETVARNVEICRLRRSSPEHWTMQALAKKYDVTRQAIEKVINQEAKWIRLSKGNQLVG